MPILAYVFFGVPQMLSSFLMICICVGTDIFPSLAMIYEPAEADLMDRMPRSRTGEKLVNIPLLTHAFFFTGLYEAFASFTMFFCFMYFESDRRIAIQDLIFCFDNWKDGFKGFSMYELTELLNKGQTVYFATLIICQIGNLLSTRTRRLSIIQQNPFGKRTGNKFLGGAAVISLLIAIMVAHLPLFQSIFKTREIPVQYWFIPIAWAIGLLILDELRKLIVRALPWWISRRIFW
jgi:sodium/potassium-transporting ATPase subunit alpha